MLDQWREYVGAKMRLSIKSAVGRLIRWAAEPQPAPQMAVRLNDATDEEINAFIERIAKPLAQKLMLTPTFLGDYRKVHVGQCVSLVNTLFNTSSGDVFIEDFVFFGHDCHVLTGTHRTDVFDMDRLIGVPETGRDIVIERGAWIATGATIIGPCRIGRNAVVGVGAVVTSDVKAGWFYGGVPAKPIKPVSPEYAST